MAHLTKPEVIERFESYIQNTRKRGFNRKNIEDEISEWINRLVSRDYLENAAFIWNSDKVMHLYFVNDSDCKHACTIVIDFKKGTCAEFTDAKKIIIHDPVGAYDRAMRGV